MSSFNNVNVLGFSHKHVYRQTFLRFTALSSDTSKDYVWSRLRNFVIKKKFVCLILGDNSKVSDF